MLATEILENADDIADLTNSDFMSDKQKNRILNENYRAIYQKIVNHGDRYLLQVLKPNEEGKYILPNDFYQLHSITAGHGAIQIPRKVIGMSESSSGYIITKDEIIIKGYTNVEVLYYPKPEKIFTNTQVVLRPAYEGIPYREGYPAVEPVPPVHRDGREGRAEVNVPSIPAVPVSMNIASQERIDVMSGVSLSGLNYGMFGDNIASCNWSTNIQKFNLKNSKFSIIQLSTTQPYTIVQSVIIPANATSFPVWVMFGGSLSNFFTFDDIADIINEPSTLNKVFLARQKKYPTIINSGVTVDGTYYQGVLENPAFANFYKIENNTVISQAQIPIGKIWTTAVGTGAELSVAGNNISQYGEQYIGYIDANAEAFCVRATRDVGCIIYKHYRAKPDGTQAGSAYFITFIGEGWGENNTLTLETNKDLKPYDRTHTLPQNWWFVTDNENDLSFVYYDINGVRKKRNKNTVIDDNTDYTGIADLNLIENGSNVFWHNGQIHWTKYYTSGSKIQLDNGVEIETKNKWVWQKTYGGIDYIITQDNDGLGVYDYNGARLYSMPCTLPMGCGIIGEKFCVAQNTSSAVSYTMQYNEALPEVPSVYVPAVPEVPAVDIDGLEGRPAIPEIQAIPPVPEVVDTLDTNIKMRNNLFFDVLAYMCALQYKQKQGADTTAIQQQLQDKMEVFFDTLTEDDYERLRVRNVY